MILWSERPNEEARMRAKGLLVVTAVVGCAVAASDFEVSCLSLRTAPFCAEIKF